MYGTGLVPVRRDSLPLRHNTNHRANGEATAHSNQAFGAFWSRVTPPELLYIWLLSFDELRLAMNAHLPVVRPLLCYARRGATPMHQKDSLPLLPERFIVISTLCVCCASPAACCWCRVSCCLFLMRKMFYLLKYNQSRIAQARDKQVEENQDQSMKDCSHKELDTETYQQETTAISIHCNSG